MKWPLPPGLTWRQIGKRIYTATWDDAIFARAAQLSYYFLLSIFPLLLLLTGVLGLIAGSESELLHTLVAYIRTAAPGAAGELLTSILREIADTSGGIVVSIGALAALWSASLGMRAVIDGLNRAYRVREARSWWKGILIGIALTVAVSMLVILALVTLIWGGRFGSYVADQFGLGGAFQTLWRLLNWPMVIGFVFVAFMLVYQYAPNVQGRKWIWNAPGALLAVALWMFVSFALRAYLGQFGDYARFYGSLGAVIILMLWLYLIGAAILIGGEVNSEIAQAAARAGEREAEVHAKEGEDVKPGDEPLRAT
jgi:membrane protein